ncbi:MAG TPA: hypothetical protein DFR83_19215 [Deltaproteobacteria bacterium]|nr:hypothetical protein [Deltaproteobacteria bacterium]
MQRAFFIKRPQIAFLAALGVACSNEDPTKIPDGEASEDSGITYTYDDADEDTIIDIHDGMDEDADGDGDMNYMDDDSDGDTIKDRLEAGDGDPLTLPRDSDGDGTADYLDTDSDNNCVSDFDEKRPTGEGPVDSDGDGTRDFADPDNDGDGILDVDEIGAECALLDSDGDGISDYMDLDSDNDGIYDVYEAGNSEFDSDPADTDGDGTPDYLDTDSDEDGIPDGTEGGVVNEGDEPRDTDGDGIYDFVDTDSDGDSLPDAEEVGVYNTDPYDPDTDGDGYSDGGEVAAGTDPLDAGSVVDGVYVEVPERTNIEELFTFTLEIQLGDVAFLIDTTGSMGSTANAMASEFTSIVSSLTATIPDAEYAVGTYDDYACCGYGYSSNGDKPFIMRQQVTNDIAQVNNVLNTQVQLHYGGDGPESSMEALYQGASGEGYDMNCDRSYDSLTDVQPFLSSTTDPFSGSGGQHFSSSSTGGGLNGGFGFRDYALPVIVFATDYDLRDPDNGYPSPGTYTPGWGCPQDAGQSDVVAALSDLGGYVIGIQANNYTSTPYDQMVQLANASGSFADTDGDGVADDPLAFRWTGSSSTFRTTITSAIETLVSSIKFDRVSLEVDGDTWGFVTGIDPEYFTDIDTSAGAGAQEIEFILEFRGVVAATTEDQLFRLTLTVVGDDTVLLDTKDIIVLVPGSSY